MAALTKPHIRTRIWTRLREKKAARFPFPLENRIPNFKGAEAAAARLGDEPVYRNAKTLKCNPDSPQRPVRQRALEDGKTVYLAVPRLKTEKCFIRLDPNRIPASRWKEAATISGAARYGVPVHPRDMPELDLIVAGSVAVRTGDGARLGKGEGYSDLEFAVAVELGLLTRKTEIATTVHDEQVVEDRWRVEPYDIPVDRIVTPTRTLPCRSPHPRPRGILWERLDPARLEAIPLLQTMKKSRRRPGSR